MIILNQVITMNSFLSKSGKLIIGLASIFGFAAFSLYSPYILAETGKPVTRESIEKARKEKINTGNYIPLSEAFKECPTNNNSEDNSDLNKVVTANTNFSFQLWQEILKERNNKNLFISPASATMALQMTYNGARGDTQTAMAKVLGLETIDLQSLNQTNADLQSSLNKNNADLQISSANSLWVSNKLQLATDFQKNTEKFYNSPVQTLNFADANSPKIINNWVKKATKNKITKMVDKISPNTRLFILNAVYFYGKWQVAFEQKETKKLKFNLMGGKNKLHPLMFKDAKFSYYENEDFQAVRLPYKGDDFSMYIFLPRPNSNLNKFYQNLHSENWQKWLKCTKNVEGLIGLPRFKLEDEIKLNNPLQKLGMEVAFNPDNADFSGIGKDKNKLFIKDVLQKTFVNVNEEGTEASAVTKVEIATKSAQITKKIEPFTMIADRPFFFVIKSDRTNTILFMGSIVDPK